MLTPNTELHLPPMHRLLKFYKSYTPIPLGKFSLAACCPEAILQSVVCYRVLLSTAYSTSMCRIKFTQKLLFFNDNTLTFASSDGKSVVARLALVTRTTPNPWATRALPCLLVTLVGRWPHAVTRTFQTSLATVNAIEAHLCRVQRHSDKRKLPAVTQEATFRRVRVNQSFPVFYQLWLAYTS